MKTCMRIFTASSFTTDKNGKQLGLSFNGQMIYSVRIMGCYVVTSRGHPPPQAHAAACLAPRRSASRGKKPAPRVSHCTILSIRCSPNGKCQGLRGRGGRRQREVPAVWNRVLRDYPGVGTGRGAALPFAGRLHWAEERGHSAMLPVTAGDPTTVST